jgi:hypothetical protein
MALAAASEKQAAARAGRKRFISVLLEKVGRVKPIGPLCGAL